MVADLEHVGLERDPGGEKRALDLLPGIAGQQDARFADRDAHHDRSLVLFGGRRPTGNPGSREDLEERSVVTKVLSGDEPPQP
jgi:hypothetical protein